MKTVLVIIDGLGDDPIKELGYKTPLESSFTPFIDYISQNGKIGRINTVFEGYPIESMICIMGLLGYEPEKYYPSGRASFEAIAKGIPLNPTDLVLRCNLISLDQSQTQISDFTAGLISDNYAKKVISKIKLPNSNWELYPGQSYRNTLIIRDANVDVKKLKCFEPHMNIGKNIMDILPRTIDSLDDILIQEVRNFLVDTIDQINKMDLPSDCKSDMLWVWSPSVKPVWPTFKSRSGLDTAFVGALDFLHGIAMAADIDFEIIPGATGYIDTDYEAKGKYAKKYIKEKDFVLVHINATDEEAHQYNYNGKKEAIEKIDKHIIGPILYELEKNYTEDFRLVVCGDHETRSTDGKHGSAPVPYVVYGKDIIPNSDYSKKLNEKNCLNFVPSQSLDFLNEIVNYDQSK